nr:MAG TPA: hypothetical protein [Caudoviricetes sp.]
MLNIIYLQNFSVLPVYFCLRRSADTVSGYFIGGMQGGRGSGRLGPDYCGAECGTGCRMGTSALNS